MTRLFDARQYRVLLASGLRLTLTGGRSAQGGVGSDSSRHLLGASYSLSLSTLMAWILVASATPGQFLMVAISLSMIFTATAIVGELTGGLFHPLDLKVTGHLPVSGFTRFAARLSEVLVLLCILTLNFNLTPAIFLAFMTGHFSAFPLLLAIGFGAVVFTAAACLLLYLLLIRFLSIARFEGAILYMNIFISLGILGLLINSGRLLQGSVMRGVASGDWPLHLPPAWFAGSVLEAAGLPGGSMEAVFAAVLSITVALACLLAAVLGSNHRSGLAGGGRDRGCGRSCPGPLMRLFEAVLIRPEERAAFEFTAVNLGRDRGFRMKAYPILGIPILLMVLSLHEAKDPLFFIFMLHLMNLYLPLVIAFLPFSDSYEGGWIFDTLPFAEIRRFSIGVEKAILYRLALPLFLLNAAVLSLVWAPLEGCLNAFYAFLAGLFIAGATVQRMNVLPFSREFRGAVPQIFSGMIGISLGVLTLAAWLQYTTWDDPILFSAQIVLMLLLHAARFVHLRRLLDRAPEAAGT